jgi:hypothetical protein
MTAATTLLPTSGSDYSWQIMNDLSTPPAGHTFLLITGPNGFSQSYGFAPQPSSSGLPTAFGNGIIDNESTHPVSPALTLKA